MINADGTGLTLLTARGSNLMPTWSPDGARIAFCAGRDGNNEIYVMNADGSGQTNITNNPASDCDPAWGPVTGAMITSTIQKTATPGSSPTPTITPTPAQVFAEPILKAIANRQPNFSDDFSNPSSGWALGPLSDANKNLLGDRGYKDGEFFLESLPNLFIGTMRGNTPIYSDFVVEVDVRFISGSTFSSWTIDFRDNYAITYGMEGSMTLFRYLRVGTRSLGEWGPFRSGLETNQLRVIVKGPSIAIYLNGTAVAPAHDDTYAGAGGSIGLSVASNDPQKGARVHFDNFKIWDISNLP